MSTRARLITTQAAIVSVLVVLVYTIFLSPDGDGPLTGIEGPRGGPTVQKPTANPKPRQGPARGDGAPLPPAGEAAPEEPTFVEYNDSVTQLRILLRDGG